MFAPSYRPRSPHNRRISSTSIYFVKKAGYGGLREGEEEGGVEGVREEELSDEVPSCGAAAT